MSTPDVMFGAVLNVMREKELLGGCLDLLGNVRKVCTFSDQSYMGLPVEDDGSMDIAQKKGADIVILNTKRQSERRNAALEHLQGLGIEYALIVDADEWWSKRALDLITEGILKNPAEVYQFKLTHMFRRPNWSVPSPNDRGTIIAMRTDQRFDPDGNRAHTGDTRSILTTEPVRIYHFSYVRSPEKIAEKIKNFSHAPEVIPDWFEKVFLPCQPSSQNVHPTVPEAWPYIEVLELPDEVKSRIPEHLWTA